MYWRKGVLLFFLFLGMVACDTAPSPKDLGNIPPLLSDLSYTPQEIAFELLPPAQVNGDIAQIPLNLQVKVSDVDGGTYKGVFFDIYAPENVTEPFLSGTLTSIGNGTYSTTETLSLNKANIGKYIIKIFAIDTFENESNQLIGTLNFRATSQPPVLENVDAPSQVKRPAVGASNVIFPIIATVSDPDGLGNIERVVLRTQSGSELLLLDDGGQNSNSGDSTANDGQYTITVQISSNNALGVNVFAFQAFDRAGLASNIITKTIEVIE